MQVLIIGAGPAGIVTGEVIKKERPDSQVILFTDEKSIFVRCTAPYVIAGIDDLAKCIVPDDFATSKGLQLIREKVVEVNIKEKKIRTETGKEFSYDYLVFATGARPFVPPIEGSNLKNVFVLRTAEDTKTIKEAIERAKRVVIVGGGMIGVEVAALLAGKKEVTIVELLPHLMYTAYDSEFCEEAEKLLSKAGVKLILGKKVEKIVGTEVVESVQVDGETIPADVVLLCVGIRANKELAEKAGIATEKFGIKTNERMQTSAENVYAVGDCAASFSAVTGKPTPSGLVTTAIAQAKVAAKNILGQEAKFSGVTNASVTKLFDYSFGRVGLTEEQAKKEGIPVKIGRFEGLTKYDMQPDAKPLKVKLVFNADKELIGAQIFTSGNYTSAFIDFASFAITKKVKAEELAELLYSAHPELTPLPFFNAIVSASEEVLQ